MPLPGLHVVTDDGVLASPRFDDTACALLAAHGPAIAFHLRGPSTRARELYRRARTLTPAAREADALLLINDRVDIALATGVGGVQLGGRSLPITPVRELNADWRIGVSVHSPGEAAERGAADFLVLGTIWPSASHPERDGAGLTMLERVLERVRTPVIAIGGVTPERAARARAAGAAGIAVVSGIWEAADPVEAAADYLKALDEVEEKAT